MKVLVTGASKGLGRGIAEYLLAAGWDVLGCARSPDASVPFRYIGGIDFSEPETLRALEGFLADSDALVNNVGVGLDGLLATQAAADIGNVIQVNLTSTLLLTKEYIRARLAHRCPGIILNVSSIIGVRGYAGLAAYSASKAGLDGMTRALARELGPKGFRVNSILPGYVDTDMSAALTPAQRSQIVRRTPLGRLATVEDVAPVAEFLLGERSRFITGQCLVVDGGITV